jgi:hypothetical protein
MKHRPCDICGSSSRRPVYQQRFAQFDDHSTTSGYDVVTCVKCGYAFADHIPDEAFYVRYYREMSKYHDSCKTISVTSTHPSYSDVVKALASRFTDRSVSIIDVGTGSGHLLGAFKSAGYDNLLGVEVSPERAISANRRYGIRTTAASMQCIRDSGDRFDLVLLTSVLEHLYRPIESLRQAAELTTAGGSIFAEVPNVARFAQFADPPFQQFSIEHINYYSASSLCNAFGQVGFAEDESWEDVRRVGTTAEPSISGLFRASPGRQAIVRDDITPTALEKYVAASRVMERNLATRISEIGRSREPVIVWGVGTLTLRLLLTEFRSLNIVAFVDSNPNYHEKRINGIPILAPEALRRRPESVVVASRAYQGEIEREIREGLGLPNHVFTLMAGSEFR